MDGGVGFKCDWERSSSETGKSGNGLARLAFLQDADPVVLSAAAPLARWLTVGPSTLVLDFSDATDDVFFVVEGAVRVLVRTPLGQEVILGDLGSGAVFGEMAAIDELRVSRSAGEASARAAAERERLNLVAWSISWTPHNAPRLVSACAALLQCSRGAAESR